MRRSIKIRVQNLKIGMFVCKLDRDWLDTPFPLEGLWINSPDEIESLKIYCDSVWVDPDKSWIKLLDSMQQDKATKKDREDRPASSSDDHHEDAHSPQEVSFAEEIGAARECYGQADDMIRSIMDDVEKGLVPALEPIKVVVQSMLESIWRNSDALLWLTLLRNKDNYTYEHCLHVSIHMMNFGKFLGLPKHQQNLVGVAGLLQDIGKMRLPRKLLNNPGKFSTEAHKIARKHVQYSLEIVARHPKIPQTVRTAIEQHHERFDGKGYPAGLKGNQISMFGHMSSIVDTYNAMLSERPGGSACSSFHAITTLHEGKGTVFHPALVERFIQCIGVYSPGTVVELNTGELAFVIEQHKTRRLLPKLLVIYDSEKKPIGNPYIVELLDPNVHGDQTGHSIKRIVEPSDFEIDLKKYYL